MGAFRLLLSTAVWVTSCDTVQQITLLFYPTLKKDGHNWEHYLSTMEA